MPGLPPGFFFSSEQYGRFDVKESLIGRITDVLKKSGINALKQGRIMGGASLAQQYANTLIDIAVMGSKSNYGQYIQSLMSKGLSAEDATRQANTEFFIMQPAIALGQGFFMGAITGGVKELSEGIKSRLADKGVTEETSKPVSTAQNRKPEDILSDAMDKLHNISDQMVKKSRNINNKGLSLDEANNALMDLLSGKGDVTTAAGEIVKSIDAALANKSISNGIKKKLTDIRTTVEPYVDKKIGNMVESIGRKGTKYDNIKLDELSEKDKADIAEDIRKNGGSPIEIPECATVNPQSKKAGYQQISYTWSDVTYKYEARWHTETPGATKYDRGTTWVVTRKIPGTAKGVESIIEYKTGDVWTDIGIWKAAERANMAGIATEEQMKLLESGHWLAK